MAAHAKAFEGGRDSIENLASTIAEANVPRTGRSKIQEAPTERMEGLKSELGDLGPVSAVKKETSM
eukprot:10756372-Heterocapsa_arctica.AAC.1